jgi:type IV secretory pathway TrbD component
MRFWRMGFFRMGFGVRLWRQALASGFGVRLWRQALATGWAKVSPSDPRMAENWIRIPWSCQDPHRP